MGTLRRLWALLRRRRLDREFDEEVTTHLILQEQEFRRSGMSANQARDAALREFGGVAMTKELCRERRGVSWIETAGKDLRYATRGLRQNKAFAIAAVLSLALGIGANTAIFTLFRALMLRMLPVARPQELVTLYRTGGWGRGYSSYPLYLEIQKRGDLFQAVLARSSVDKVRFSTGAPGGAETVQREHVTGNYFQTLGVGAAIGRLIGDEDNRTPHAHPVAVLSYDFWQRRFGGDPGVLGRSVTVNEQPLTVIGVAGRGFAGVEVDHQADLWLPAMMRSGEIMDPGDHWAWIVARRRTEVPLRQIQAAVDVLLRQYLTQVYGANKSPRFRKIAMAQQIEVRDGGIGISLLRDQFGTSLRVLMAAVGLVLLAACANVANLLLARGAARGKEMALRISLGATSARLIAQGLIESFLLAVLGAAAGVAFAHWGTGAILAFLPEPLAVSPDGTVLAVTAGLAGLAAILFGLGPAVRSSRVDPAAGLRMSGGDRAPRAVLRRSLVVAQVAFSVVLVAMAVLFGHSMSQLRSVDLGLRADNVVTFSMDFPPAWSAPEKAGSRDRLLEAIAPLPGVSSVSYAFPGPFRGGTSRMTVHVPGSAATATEEAWANVHAIGPRYFETIGSGIVEGRDVSTADRTGARRVAVVNEAFVRHFLPGESRVLDRVLSMGKDTVAIVGVTRDIAHDGLRVRPEPTVYLPAAQAESSWEPTIVARAAVPPETLVAAVRREAAKLGPQVAISDPQPLRRRIDNSIFQDRLLATVGGFFGLLALALAAVGLYGVVAYGAARRAREIGIRIALGARREAVLWMVLRDALVLVAAGLAAGLPVSYAAARQVASLLFGVKPLDAVTFVATAGVLGAIGVAAALVPARRAAALEPLSVLRQD